MIKRTISPRAWKTAAVVGLMVLSCSLFVAPASFASFGISSFSATAVNRDGSVDLEAGSHPFEYVVHLSLNTNSSGELEGIMRELSFDLPPGLVGDPQAIPRCSGAQFEGLQVSARVIPRSGSWKPRRKTSL